MKKLSSTKISLFAILLAIAACSESKKDNPVAKSSFDKIEEEAKRDDEFTDNPFNYQVVMDGDDLVIEKRARKEDAFEAESLSFEVPSRESRDSNFSLPSWKLQKFAQLNAQLLIARTLSRSVKLVKDEGNVEDYYWIAIKPDGSKEFTLADLDLDANKLTINPERGRVIVYYPILNSSGKDSVLPIAASPIYLPALEDIKEAVKSYLEVIRQAR